jgi:hypothetical protein
MGKSFKLRLLVYLFIGTAVVIFANRLLAQHFLSEQLKERLQLELAQGLHHCGQELEGRERYLQCFDRIEAKNLTAVVANEHRHCPPVRASQEASGPCRVLREEAAPWTPTNPVWALPIERAEVTVEGQRWYSVRRTGQSLGDVLMLRQADVNRLGECRHPAVGQTGSLSAGLGDFSDRNELATGTAPENAMYLVHNLATKKWPLSDKNNMQLRRLEEITTGVDDKTVIKPGACAGVVS